MSIRDVIAKAAQGAARGIAGFGYRLGSGAIWSEMQIPPGLGYENYLKIYGQVGWLFGAVSIISESVADNAWKLYRTDRGEREEVTDHPLTELLKHVNRFQTWYQFSQLLQMYIGLVGESFIVLNKAKIAGVEIPVEMWLAPPQYMVVRPDATKYISHYEYRRGTNVLELPVEDVIHIMSPDPSNPFRGLGTAQSIGVDLDSERYATRYTNRLFYNDATPGMLIEFPSLPPKPQRDQLREEWDEIHRGWRNARKTGFLWGGAKANLITMTNRDMDFWRLRKINRETILGAYRIPTSLMGLAEVGSRARAETDEYIFAKRVIRPALTRIREALNEQLVPMFDSRLEVDYDDPVPENREQMVKECDTLVKNGTITREEARQKLGYERDAPEGDTFLGPAKESAKDAPLALGGKNIKALNDDQKRARWDRYVARTAGQEPMIINMLASLWDDQMREIIKGVEAGKLDDFYDDEAEIDKFKESFEPIIFEIFSSAYEDVLKELEGENLPGGKSRQEGILNQEAVEWIATRSLFLSTSLNNTTKSQVRKVLTDAVANGESVPQMTRKIRGYFKEGLEKRAPMTARTETIAASNEGALQGYEAEGLEKVEFLLDYGHDWNLGCECEPLSGNEFAVKDSHGVIPLHPNCRCTWVPVVD